MARRNRVSVILTSYNQANYLRASIDSVLNQTFSDFEVRIWDDASTDGSWEIISSYSDQSIHAFRTADNTRGAYMAQAVAEAGGVDFVAIQHSDDYWEPQKLEKQVAFLDQHPEIGAVFSNALIITETGEPLRDPSHPYSTVFDQPNRTRQQWLNHFFYRGNALCHSSVLIRKSCYDVCGSYRQGLAQIPDLDLWVRLCQTYEIHVLPDKLVRFRVHSDSASADTPQVRSRWDFEFLQVVGNYRRISSAEELLAIFPSARKYALPDGIDLGYALGMVALEAPTPKPAKLFGLQLLFEALNDRERAARIKALYGFEHPNLVGLAAEYDVFSIDWVESLSAKSVQSEQDLRNLTGKLAQSEQDLRNLTGQLAQSEQAVTDLTSEVKAMQSRLSVRLAGRLQAFVETLLPQGTRRRATYEILHKDARILFAEGPSGVWSRLRYASPSELASRRDLAALRINVRQPENAVVVVSHDARTGGASHLALHICRVLHEVLGKDVFTILLDGGPLTGEFERYSQVYSIDLKDTSPPEQVEIADGLVAQMQAQGLSQCIANTTLSGSLLPILKEHGFRVVTLIHELPTSIALLNSVKSAQNIVRCSDRIVFPADFVRGQFLQAYGPREENAVVRPQGLYRTIPDGMARAEARGRIRSKIRAHDNATIVIGCAYGDLRKGVDVFVEVGRRLLVRGPGLDVHLVWIGDVDAQLKRWLEHDMRVLQSEDHLHILGYVEDPLPIFLGADVFLLTSREDPFPAVVPMAMDAEVPVVAFDKAGGIRELLSGGRGIIVPYLDVEAMVNAVADLIRNPNQRDVVVKRAKAAVDQELGFSDYVGFLLKLLQTPEVT